MKTIIRESDVIKILGEDVNFKDIDIVRSDRHLKISIGHNDEKSMFKSTIDPYSQLEFENILSFKDNHHDNDEFIINYEVNYKGKELAYLKHTRIYNNGNTYENNYLFVPDDMYFIDEDEFEDENSVKIYVRNSEYVQMCNELWVKKGYHKKFKTMKENLSKTNFKGPEYFKMESEVQEEVKFNIAVKYHEEYKLKTDLPLVTKLYGETRLITLNGKTFLHEEKRDVKWNRDLGITNFIKLEFENEQDLIWFKGNDERITLRGENPPVKCWVEPDTGEIIFLNDNTWGYLYDFQEFKSKEQWESDIKYFSSISKGTKFFRLHARKHNKQINKCIKDIAFNRDYSRTELAYTVVEHIYNIQNKPLEDLKVAREESAHVSLLLEDKIGVYLDYFKCIVNGEIKYFKIVTLDEDEDSIVNITRVYDTVLTRDEIFEKLGQEVDLCGCKIVRKGEEVKFKSAYVNEHYTVGYRTSFEVVDPEGSLIKSVIDIEESQTVTEYIYSVDYNGKNIAYLISIVETVLDEEINKYLFLPDNVDVDLSFNCIETIEIPIIEEEFKEEWLNKWKSKNLHIAYAESDPNDPLYQNSLREMIEEINIEIIRGIYTRFHEKIKEKYYEVPILSFVLGEFEEFVIVTYKGKTRVWNYKNEVPILLKYNTFDYVKVTLSRKVEFWYPSESDMLCGLSDNSRIIEEEPYPRYNKSVMLDTPYLIDVKIYENSSDIENEIREIQEKEKGDVYLFHKYTKNVNNSDEFEIIYKEIRNEFFNYDKMGEILKYYLGTEAIGSIKVLKGSIVEVEINVRNKDGIGCELHHTYFKAKVVGEEKYYHFKIICSTEGIKSIQRG